MTASCAWPLPLYPPPLCRGCGVWHDGQLRLECVHDGGDLQLDHDLDEVIQDAQARQGGAQDLWHLGGQGREGGEGEDLRYQGGGEGMT